MYYIYKTTCLVNGKIYVGKAKVRPYHESYLGSGTAFENALRKYKRENFSKEILETFESEDEAFAAEVRYVAQFRAREDAIGYNIAPGGTGRSEASYRDQRRKPAKAMTFEQADAVHAKWGSEEHRKKVSETGIRVWANLDEAGLQRMHEAAVNKWTEERKQARRELLAERLSDPEASAAYRKKLSEAVRAANERDDVKAKRSAAMNEPVLKERLRQRNVEINKNPIRQRLNKEVRQPLSVITRLLNNGRISEEEAQSRRAPLYIIQEEIFELLRKEKCENANNARPL